MMTDFKHIFSGLLFFHSARSPYWTWDCTRWRGMSWRTTRGPSRTCWQSRRMTSQLQNRVRSVPHPVLQAVKGPTAPRFVAIHIQRLKVSNFVCSQVTTTQVGRTGCQGSWHPPLPHPSASASPRTWCRTSTTSAATSVSATSCGSRQTSMSARASVRVSRVQ